MISNEVNKPLVTVYMPTFNRVELLSRAVESVLNQSYSNIELIVVDDLSSDSTFEYLSNMSKKDHRFKYFINEKNSGACVSRNKAIFEANGKFITGLDDDDYFLPNRISSFLQTWDSKPNDCIALYSNAYRKDKKDTLKKLKKVRKCSGSDLISSNWIGNQIFTKTDYLRSIGGFDETLKAWQDLECWYRLLNNTNKKAYLTDATTYVVDISHPHERISNSKVDSVIEAYSYFCTKHNLGWKEKKVLKLQLYPYTREKPDFISSILNFNQAPKFQNIRRSISLSIKSFIEF